MNLASRQLRPIEIAFRDADAGDADLAGLAEFDRDILLGVENDDRIGRKRLADGHRLVGSRALPSVAVTVVSVGP